MKNITTMNTTQVTRVRFAYPQAADRNLAVSARGGDRIAMHESATSNAPDAKDVAFFRSRRPPV